jgi:hypothetical protein
MYLSFRTGAMRDWDGMLAQSEVKIVGIAADILGLRNHHFSSVAELLSALDQVCDAPPDKIAARVFLAGAAADLVLTNVAAHAAEALSEQPTNRKTRRAASPSRRKNRRLVQGPPSRQRILFA